MKPIFFASPAEFRKWLRKHHKAETELLVGFHKKHTGKPTMTWSESVDQALCFGWIDGVRRSLDDERYTIRFTPRKQGSNWSAVNIKKVAALTEAGLMQPAGLKAFEARDPRKTDLYSFEQREQAVFDKDSERRFKSNKPAWKFFQAQPDGYRKLMTFWVMSAKREETRQRRLDRVIAQSAAGRRVDMMRPNGP